MISTEDAAMPFSHQGATTRRLKRAGLDYWPKVVVKVHDDWQNFQQHWELQPDPKRMHAFTKFSQRSYSLPGPEPSC